MRMEGRKTFVNTTRALEPITGANPIVCPPEIPRDDATAQRAPSLRPSILKERIRDLDILTDNFAARIERGNVSEVLDKVYDSFRMILPYDRMCLAIVEKDKTIRAIWVQSDTESILIPAGYTASLEGSSLAEIISSAQPRVLNDLGEYRVEHPHSPTIKLILQEGMLSSLTCPIIANGKAGGLLFFSSKQAQAFTNADLEIFLHIAAQLGRIVERATQVCGFCERAEIIRAQNAKLQHLNVLKNRFVGMAAHDLQGPLGQIRWAAELLLNDTLEPAGDERRSKLEMIHRLSEHMCSMVHNMLDISLIEAGRLELQRSRFAVSQLLREVVSDHAPLASNKEIGIAFERIDSATLVGDVTHLRQVIDNLISNAIKYSSKGSRISVLGVKDSEYYRIVVADNGPGIPVEEEGLLFQDFQRLSSRPTGGEKSTGLGLAIAKRIVTAHGGSIGHENRAGGGANFWFTIPLSDPPANGERLVSIGASRGKSYSV